MTANGSVSVKPIVVRLTESERRADALHGRQRQQLAEENSGRLRYPSDISGLPGGILGLHGETAFFKACPVCGRGSRVFEEDNENFLNKPDIIFPDKLTGELKTRHFHSSNIKVLYENSETFERKTRHMDRLVFATVVCGSGLEAIERADAVSLWGYVAAKDIPSFPLKEVDTRIDVGAKTMAYNIPLKELMPFPTEWLAEEYATDRVDGWFG